MSSRVAIISGAAGLPAIGSLTVAITLELLHHFDAVLWRTAPALSSPASTVLVTWTVIPPSVDAGIPEVIAAVFAEALCSIGPVIYAGDDSESDFRLKEQVIVSRGLRQVRLALFRAVSVANLLPAFSEPRHDWSMNAQWLVVVDSLETTQDLGTLFRELFGDWRLPERFPPGVAMIVQAAVDGDGAACHSVSRAVEERFVSTLLVSSQTAGFELRIDPAG
jgi:hypothetical protein